LPSSSNWTLKAVMTADVAAAIRQIQPMRLNVGLSATIAFDIQPVPR
jgi:hypothetical protein